MSTHRYDPRRDANEAPIIAALRAAGCGVVQLSERGVPDLLCCKSDGALYLLEVKMPKGKLSEAQAVFHASWPGTIYIVRSVEDALRAIGVMD